MKEKLIAELIQLIEGGEKKSRLEELIGLPANSLSAVLGGHKEMPDSWVPKIQVFLKQIAVNKKLQGESEKPRMAINKSGVLSLTPSPEKLQALQAAMDKINKDFGPGTIMRLGDKPSVAVETISTGSLGVDMALGIGGLPKGRIIEIYGPESSGKTTLALHTIAEAQRQGGKCAFIDAEHAFDEIYATALGVNIADLHLSQPDYGEQALEETDRLIESGAIAVIVIDSVAALVPKGELEGEMGDTKMGLQARLMSQACRKLTGSISRTKTICIFINQLRAVIGNMWGPSEITTGGNALKFYASVRLDVRATTTLKDGEEMIGKKVKVRVAKSKVAPPFKTAEFDVLFGQGIDKKGEIVDIAAAMNIIQKAGSWYAYDGNKLGQGRDAAIKLLEDNEDLTNEIMGKILQNK